MYPVMPEASLPVSKWDCLLNYSDDTLVYLIDIIAEFVSSNFAAFLDMSKEPIEELRSDRIYVSPSKNPASSSERNKFIAQLKNQIISILLQENHVFLYTCDKPIGILKIVLDETFSQNRKPTTPFPRNIKTSIHLDRSMKTICVALNLRSIYSGRIDP